VITVVTLRVIAIDCSAITIDIQSELGSLVAKQFTLPLVLTYGNEVLYFVFLFCKDFAELAERVKLLEVSRSLSEDEVRKLKFDARNKRKVDGYRYEEIKDGLDLFEELENNGELSHLCVRELLQGIHRFDLVDILTQPGTGKRTFPLL